MVIFDRFRYGFADRFVAREMDDRVDVFFFEDSVQCFAVQHVHFIESRCFAGDRFDPVQHFRFAVRIVVDDDDFLTCFQ